MEDIKKSIEVFIHNLDALAHSFPVVMKSTFQALEIANKDWLHYMEEHAEKVEERDNKKRFLLPPERRQENQAKKKKFEKLKTSSKLLPRNYLVSFVSEYDAYLGQLTRAILKAKPELLNDCDRQLTFSELTLFKNIDEAREHILDKEVESLLRNSHHQQFRWLESKFHVTLTTGLKSWPTFIEIMERRNLFVHCDGIVSEQYLKNCKEHGVDVSQLKVGDKLVSDPSYLREAYVCLYEISVKLSQVLWRKQFPDQRNSADESIIEVTYELLLNEQYETCKRLLEFGVDTIKNHASDINKRILCINKALVHKFLNEDKQCLKTIDSFDWSACGDHFKLAVAALKGNNEEVHELMRDIGCNNKNMPKVAYLEWPLFKKYRESEAFMAVFYEVFGEDSRESADVVTFDNSEIISP
ncbi:hypothetical protein [Aeromonas veronii]|uniref:hypothetical protein n=1 Tax=Aeromonas veronii TaxID=654 RepID=UPI000DD02AA5|nr:hypothetical protein [Aeromonas veronii]